MKIKDIQIDGFGVWTGLSVDSLPEGMTLFYGPNEAGKTTLMQFVRAMLYGFTPERRTRYLPPVHGGSPGGAISVTGPGGGYEIRRHSQLTDSNVTGRLAVTGSDGLSQGQHRLAMLLGQIDESIFTNVFAIGIRELQELSTLDDTSAADELYKLSSGLDRVSLVDVLRSLKAGRRETIGGVVDANGDGIIDEEEERAAASKLTGLMSRREKLRDEIQRLSGQTRRWSELATQRRTQSQEIETLRGRMVAWEREARCVEIATGVYDDWQRRFEINSDIERIESETQLPDDAPGQLVQIDAMMEERRGKLEEIKNKRRSLRDKAEQLPVNKRLFDLQGRIEAASQQATWIEALEEQIERLDSQIEKARTQVDADADRIGVDEDEKQRINQGDLDAMPDLSRQTLAALSSPAKEVKEQLFLLKQAREEGKGQKQRVHKLADQLDDVLQKARASDLQAAIRRENDDISSLRHRIQLGQHLEKLVRHYRDLERESVELKTDEAIPADRLLLLGLPFIGGGMAVLYGLFNIFRITTFVAQPSPTTGMIWTILGAMALLVYYLSSEKTQRSTSADLEDCERQIESVRRQIRDVESERNDVDSIDRDTLGTSITIESLESRLRESESLLAELEDALPTYHAHEAADQAYKATYRRATHAAEGLKAARRQWSATLDRLGLSTKLSPKSVRILGDGYETLLASMRKLSELRDERDQRRRERQTIAKRIETLYIEALDARDDDLAEANPAAIVDVADTDIMGEMEETLASRERVDRTMPSTARESRSAATPSRRLAKTNPLDQLNHLHEELARQSHWIRRRRDLKDQDQQLRKMQSGHARAIERGEQQRRSLWAKCGVATADQFYQQVDAKSQLLMLREQVDEVDKKIRSMVGTAVEYDDVAREIDGASSKDLERRWESLTTRMSETEVRISSLQTAQGELAQSMKQLGGDDRLMTAKLELGCLERQLDSVARRWQTLATASCLLEDVCGTFERERQPETLREASTFLNQLTDGKYVRIWTPLGTNQLKIDDVDGKSLPLEVLSRGTGEAVFIALRLSLAAAYARRGVMLPLILDDVLVNFDGQRALSAARTLQTFAELGHQVMMFTCHQHIVDIFHEVGVEVRQMPPQGEPGRAERLEPEFEDEADVEYEEEPIVEEIVAYEPEPVVEPEPIVPDPVVIVEPEPTPVPLVLKSQPSTPREPQHAYRFRKLQRQHRRRRQPVFVIDPRPPAPTQPKSPVAMVREEVIAEPPVQDESIGWAWFQREPADGRIDVDEAVAHMARHQWTDPDDRDDISDQAAADTLIGYADDAFDRAAHEDAHNGDHQSSWWLADGSEKAS
ncbi:MAG: AAA family ATPase [Planctomycetota bacterium]